MHGQPLAELNAGKQYVKAPHAKIGIIDELLAKPMQQIASESLPQKAQEIAANFLKWYSKMVREP